MAFNDDYESIKKSWGSLPPTGKLIFGSSFAITLFSFASLADSAYELKGFIVNAIQFYRWATDPILSVAEFYNIKLNRVSLDAIALILIVTHSIYKYSFRLGMKNLGRLYQYIICPAGVFSLLFYSAEVVFFWAVILCIEYLFRLTAIFVYASFGDPNKEIFIFHYTRKHVRDVMLKSILHFLSPIVLVGVIAAISEGLNRPL